MSLMLLHPFLIFLGTFILLKICMDVALATLPILPRPFFFGRKTTESGFEIGNFCAKKPRNRGWILAIFVQEDHGIGIGDLQFFHVQLCQFFRARNGQSTRNCARWSTVPKLCQKATESTLEIVKVIYYWKDLKIIYPKLCSNGI